jgi:hypothetical protein
LITKAIRIPIDHALLVEQAPCTAASGCAGHDNLTLSCAAPDIAITSETSRIRGFAKQRRWPSSSRSMDRYGMRIGVVGQHPEKACLMSMSPPLVAGNRWKR